MDRILKTLTQLNQEYQVFERRMKSLVCPFCGCKVFSDDLRLENPKWRRLFKQQIKRMTDKCNEQIKKGGSYAKRIECAQEKEEANKSKEKKKTERILRR